MSSVSLILVIVRCVPDMLVKIEGLDCLLPSIINYHIHMFILKKVPSS